MAKSKTSEKTIVGVSKELAVAADFAKNGYEIFMPLGSVSGVDFIAIKDDVVEYVEVKSGYILKDGSLSWVKQTNDRPTILAIVNEKREIYYYPR